jgi:hypothetical protein
LLPVGSQLPFRTNRPEDLCGSGSCLTFEFRLLNYVLDGVRASDGACAASEAARFHRKSIARVSDEKTLRAFPRTVIFRVNIR